MTDIALDEKACAQTPMADHIARFWHMIETEAHVRILVEMRRDTSGNRYWDSSSFSNDVAKAIAAERRASPSQVAPADPEQVTDAMVEALNRFERAAMAYERLGKMTRDDEKTRAIRKDAIAELAQSRAALAAAIGTGGQAVAVKPLEWTVSNGDWYAGGYRVHVDLDGSPALYIVSGWHGAGTNPYGTLDEAQAAAQANHDAYIRSCLALSQPHPADERVVEAERRRAVGQGMAIAAGIVMNGWGNTVYAKEILGAAGYSSVEAMKADGVEDYDIDLCRPALDEFSAKEGRKDV